MQTLPEDVVGRAYAGTFAWETLERIVDVPERMAGSDGEADGARVVEDAFRAAGLREVEVNEFGIHGWRRGSTALSLPEPARTYDSPHEIAALPRTTDGTASGELVDVGCGLPGDFDGADLEGKIALASSQTPDDHGRFVHRREKYSRAIGAGAAGFLFYNHVEGCLPPAGSVGSSGPPDVPGEIPAAGVSKELGERLVRRCGDGDVAAELDIECTNEPTTSQNVEGVIGPDTDREVLVSAHVDAHDICEGAFDNAAGCALVAEIGRLLSGMEGDLETRVRFVVFGSEEIGSLGAERWAETHDLDGVKCIVNLDAAGSTRTLEAATYRFPGLTAAFEEAAEERGVPVEIDREVRGHTDAWPFVKRGVPGVYGSSYTGEDDRGWGHTHADTLDKLDVRDLRELVAAVATAVAKLAESDRAVEHKTVEEVRDSIDPGNEVEMKLLERYP